MLWEPHLVCVFVFVFRSVLCSHFHLPPWYYCALSRKCLNGKNLHQTCSVNAFGQWTAWHSTPQCRRVRWASLHASVCMSEAAATFLLCYWRIIAFKCYVSFCCTKKWISHSIHISLSFWASFSFRSPQCINVEFPVLYIMFQREPSNRTFPNHLTQSKFLSWCLVSLFLYC